MVGNFLSVPLKKESKANLLTAKLLGVDNFETAMGVVKKRTQLSDSNASEKAFYLRTNAWLDEQRNLLLAKLSGYFDGLTGIAFKPETEYYDEQFERQQFDIYTRHYGYVTLQFDWALHIDLYIDPECPSAYIRQSLERLSVPEQNTLNERSQVSRDVWFPVLGELIQSMQVSNCYYCQIGDAPWTLVDLLEVDGNWKHEGFREIHYGRILALYPGLVPLLLNQCGFGPFATADEKTDIVEIGVYGLEQICDFFNETFFYPYLARTVNHRNLHGAECFPVEARIHDIWFAIAIVLGVRNDVALEIFSTMRYVSSFSLGSFEIDETASKEERNYYQFHVETSLFLPVRLIEWALAEPEIARKTAEAVYQECDEGVY